MKNGAMEYWRIGVMSLMNALIHYFITPTLHYSNPPLWLKK